MDVSIIVPIYKGNKYIDKILNMIQENYQKCIDNKLNVDIELIFVNDFPEEKIEIKKTLEKEKFSVRLLNNEKNMGIHASRVNGLKNSTGKYILFLDQDDYIEDIFIMSQLSKIKDADIIIGNGIKMIGDKKKVIYRDKLKQKLAKKEKYFLYSANQIVSPGHCLLKKSSIPREWLENIVEKNGGDDLFLWLLMFEKKCKFEVNFEKVYTHFDTGENLSLNLEQMYISAENVISLGRKCKGISESTLKIYDRRINFLKEMYSANKLKKFFICFKYIDICLYKLYAYFI